MPTYTYECPSGHRWEEFRTHEGSEVSEEPCPSCMAFIDEQGLDFGTQTDFSEFAGRKIVGSPSVGMKIRGGTPTHYPNRKENK